MQTDEVLPLQATVVAVNRYDSATWTGLFKGKCKISTHEQMKKDRMAFLEGTVSGGEQEIDDGEFHEIGTCRTCGSSVIWPRPLYVKSK